MGYDYYKQLEILVDGYLNDNFDKYTKEKDIGDRFDSIYEDLSKMGIFKLPIKNELAKDRVRDNKFLLETILKTVEVDGNYQTELRRTVINNNYSKVDLAIKNYLLYDVLNESMVKKD